MKKLLLIFTILMICCFCYIESKSSKNPKTVASREEVQRLADIVYDIAW